MQPIQLIAPKSHAIGPPLMAFRRIITRSKHPRTTEKRATIREEERIILFIIRIYGEDLSII